MVQSNQRLTLFYLLRSSSTFLTLEKIRKEVIERLPKKLYETPTLTWWIQRPNIAVTSGATTTIQRIGHKLR